MSDFIILTTQRTGSTWVVDMLNSHPSIKAYSELFKNDGVGYPKWGGAKDYPFYNEKSTQDLGDYFKGLFINKNFSVGFKLMYNQYNSVPGLSKYIDHGELKIIHLYRNNLFDLYLSGLVAKKSQIYHSKKKLDYSLTPFSIGVDDFLEFVKNKKTTFNKYRTKYKKSRYMEVEYESLLNSPKKYDVILKFIGVEVYPLSSGLVKLNPENGQNLITNYEEIEAIIRNQDCFIRS